MPVRLLNKIEPSLTIMKMTFGFDHPNATIGADIFSRNKPPGKCSAPEPGYPWISVFGFLRIQELHQ